MNRSPAGWIARIVGTCFGLGYSPAAPGTIGSLGAISIALLLSHFAGWQPYHFGLLAAAAFFPAVWASEQVARQNGTEDPGCVVVDEAVGQWIALAGAKTLVWQVWLAAFLLFRLLDIWKPPPARQAESLPGGWGIVADDVVAGFCAALVLFLAGCFNLY